MVAAAASAVRGGAKLIGANEDPTHPTPTGLLPGTGALLAAVATAAETEPVVGGKPHRPMAELILARAGGRGHRGGRPSGHRRTAGGAHRRPVRARADRRDRAGDPPGDVAAAFDTPARGRPGSGAGGRLESGPGRLRAPGNGLAAGNGSASGVPLSAPLGPQAPEDAAGTRRPRYADPGFGPRSGARTGPDPGAGPGGGRPGPGTDPRTGRGRCSHGPAQRHRLGIPAPGRRQAREQLIIWPLAPPGDLRSRLLSEDVVAQFHAFIADVDARPRDQLGDCLFSLLQNEQHKIYSRLAPAGELQESSHTVKVALTARGVKVSLTIVGWPGV